MKRFVVLKVLALLMVVGVSGKSHGGLVSINFDTDANWTGSGALTSYSSGHVYSESGFVFTGGPALRQTTNTQDGVVSALGTYGWRLQDNPATWTTTYQTVSSDKSVIQSFQFDVRRWDSSPSPSWAVSYSINSGTSWLSAWTVDNTTLGNSSNWRTFSFTLPSPVTVSNGQFRIRFVRSSGERLMVDNFSLSAVPEPSALLLVGSIFGASFLRRRRA
ncbi:MAG: PEP-CTERM sorting domain-containing protein [Planctomycetaceae bacterium]|nr:PEP-CTERM sorting domain-containing protein [Planctomycetaceae bacterium]